MNAIVDIYFRGIFQVCRSASRAVMHIEQGGITCGAIEDPRKSSKAIDERVIINFCDKNVVNARFRDKNGVFILFIYMYVLSIAFLFFR